MHKLKILCFSLLIIFSSTLLLFLITLIRALILEGPDYEESEFSSKFNLEISEKYLNNAAKILGGVISIPTVSSSPGVYARDALLDMQKYLEESFPNVYGSPYVDVEIVNNYSLLYTIKSNNSVSKPYLLAAHLDVVPVESNNWERDPFLGEIVDHLGEKVIWGRGAIDDKTCVVAILSALEHLLSTSWQPSRDFYIAFGHDEEVRGNDGAGKIGEVLTSRNVSFDFILDEGMPILEGVLAGVDVPVAAIGVSEKGYLTLELKANGTGGHSSIPPCDQAVSRLAEAVTRLYQNPLPSMFGYGPEVDMLSFLAPIANWPHKLVYSNLWLFKPLVEYQMLKKRETAALLRTTTAVTMMNAGIKENVIPAQGSAIVNHRVHPAQSLDEVIQYDQSLVKDLNVEVWVKSRNEPHSISPYGPDASGFRLIASAVKTLFPDAVPVPSLLVGNTDTVYYQHLTAATYRFYPLNLTQRDIARIHASNEYVSVDNFNIACKFYASFMMFANE